MAGGGRRREITLCPERNDGISHFCASYSVCASKSLSEHDKVCQQRVAALILPVLFNKAKGSVLPFLPTPSFSPRQRKPCCLRCFKVTSVSPQSRMRPPQHLQPSFLIHPKIFLVHNRCWGTKWHPSVCQRCSLHVLSTTDFSGKETEALNGGKPWLFSVLGDQASGWTTANIQLVSAP